MNMMHRYTKGNNINSRYLRNNSSVPSFLVISIRVAIEGILGGQELAAHEARVARGGRVHGLHMIFGHRPVRTLLAAH